MKTIPIITFSEKNDKTITTLSLLKTCCENMPSGIGLDIPNMRARNKVLDVIEKAEKESATELVLEDAVYDTAKNCVKESRWAKVEKHLLAFADLFGL